MFGGSGGMDAATTGAGVMTATDWAGTASVNSTGDYAAAHLWQSNDHHDGWRPRLWATEGTAALDNQCDRAS